MMAWVRPFTGEEGLGSVVDILAAEVAAALEPSNTDILTIRDRVAERFIKFGTGEQAIRPYLAIWRQLQPKLWQREERAREIIAISRSKYLDISKIKVVEWLNSQIRTPADANRQIESLRQRLAEDIRSRGDERIPNASNVAANFFDDIKRNSAFLNSGIPNPALQYLLKQGIDEADIKLETTMEEIFDLITFRQQLRPVSSILGISWSDLKASVSMDRIPSWIIQNALRKYRQDLPRREGGELTDSHLACLAAYADITYVDKRTKENFTRARQKSPEFAAIVRRVEKAGHYRDIAQHLI